MNYKVVGCIKYLANYLALKKKSLKPELFLKNRAVYDISKM